jgi:hypothetical protein
MKMVGVGSLVEACIIYEKERNSRRKERSISTTPPPYLTRKEKKVGPEKYGRFFFPLMMLGYIYIIYTISVGSCVGVCVLYHHPSLIGVPQNDKRRENIIRRARTCESFFKEKKKNKREKSINICADGFFFFFFFFLTISSKSL